MRKNIIYLFLFCILCGIVITQGYGEEQGFLYELRLNLQAQGWEDEEIEPFMHAAQQMDWEDIEAEQGEMVAYSLQYCKQKGGETDPGEKAHIAYHLAVTGSEMKALGFEDKVITRVAVNATREIVRSLNQYRKNGGEDAMGEMIRQRIQEQLYDQNINGQQEQLIQRIRKRIAQNNQQGNPHNGTGGNGPPQ